MSKQILSLVMLLACSLMAAAQSGTNSPYSQYGLGVLSDQSQGFNRGMNGLSLGLRHGNQVNVMNPASYSAIDSLTMLFDVGMSGQITNFEEEGRSLNANNSNFEYVVASFRFMPKVGISVGLIPFTNIGYNYSSKTTIGTPTLGTAPTTSTETHSGSGGLRQAFIGIGWELMKNLSVGANLSYLWGTYDKNVTVSSSDAYVNTVVRNYGATVSSYKLDLGVQWLHEMNKDNSLTFGVTYGLGHKLGSDPYVKISNTNVGTNVSSVAEYSVYDALAIPYSFGIGAAWQHGDKLTVGADYSVQQWGALDFPEMDYSSVDNYVQKSGILMDRHKIVVGGEYVPNAFGTNFFGRMHYRMGASFATPYIKVNGADGPKEYSVSLGFGIPVVNKWNNRSMLNISGQWVRTAATDMITENMFRINIGLTFNERWFAKWKVE